MDVDAAITEGMLVYGSDEEAIGSVKAVREQHFQVSRPHARTVYVPFDAVSAIETFDEEQNVYFTIAADEVASMGWKKPPLFHGERPAVKRQ